MDVNSIYISGEVQVRWYKKILVSLLTRILEKSFSFDIKIDYSFDSSDNSLVFKKIKASNISIDSKLQDYLRDGVDVQSIVKIIEENININIPCDGKIRINLLYHEYFTKTKLYTQGNFLYTDFTTTNKKAVEDFVKVCKGLGIPITNSTHIPTPTPTSSVIRIPKDKIIMEANY